MRYYNIVIATDADVDGIHIRLLMMTFFLPVLPNLMKNGHVYLKDWVKYRLMNLCFIGPERRKEPVIIEQGEHVQQLLEYYMVKNTATRQEFI